MWRTIAIISLITFASVTNVIAAETQSKQLHELTIQQANKLLNKGEITSVELVNHYLEQIKKYDQSGPKINSVPQINTKALAIAKRLDDERRQGNIRGPLHGIPIVLKDNIDTADGMPNTAGSIALKDNFPTQDAHIVKKLR
ncbi:MAG: amidase family protein, partial [Psychrobium sp.]